MATENQTAWTFTEMADDSPPAQQAWSPDTMMSVLYILCGCVGFVSNSFVIVVIFTYTAMRKQLTNLLIIHQSLADAIASVVVIFSVTISDKGYSLYGLSGLVICRIWYSKFLLWGALTVSTLNLLAITIERFLCITKPIWYKNNFSRKHVYIICSVIWVAGMAKQSIISVLPAGVNEANKCNFYYYWPSPEFQKWVGVVNIFLKYFIPLVIMSYCYIRMAAVLKARVKPSEKKESEKSKDGGQMARARMNIFKTLLIVTICFLICWTPNQVLFLHFNLGNKINFKSWYYHGSTIMVYMNCCCNPFIYIAQYEQFQSGIRKLKGRIFGRSAEDNQSSIMQSSTDTA